MRFNSDDTILLDRVTHFIAAALKSGNAAIVVATKSHRDSLSKIESRGVDTDAALQAGTYISWDAADMLSKILVKDLPGSVLFFAGFASAIEAAAKAATSEKPQVVVFGEGVAIMKAQGKADAAIRLEQLSNELAKRHVIDILCAYPLSSFQDEEDEGVFRNVRAEHSAVYSQ